jgi:hypothetical protein
MLRSFSSRSAAVDVILSLIQERNKPNPSDTAGDNPPNDSFGSLEKGSESESESDFHILDFERWSLREGITERILNANQSFQTCRIHYHLSHSHSHTANLFREKCLISAFASLLSPNSELELDSQSSTTILNQKPPSPPSSFDLIICFGLSLSLILYRLELLETLRSLHSLLNINGHIIVQVQDPSQHAFHSLENTLQSHSQQMRLLPSERVMMWNLWEKKRAIPNQDEVVKDSRKGNPERKLTAVKDAVTVAVSEELVNGFAQRNWSKENFTSHDELEEDNEELIPMVKFHAVSTVINLIIYVG